MLLLPARDFEIAKPFGLNHDKLDNYRLNHTPKITRLSNCLAKCGTAAADRAVGPVIVDLVARAEETSYEIPTQRYGSYWP